MHEALRRLGPRDREVLLLAEWEGLSPAQIATVLGCSTVTARGRLHRARRRFRAVFEECSPRRRAAAQRPRHDRSPARGRFARRIMSTSESFEALRRANPRTRPGFAQSVESAADAVRAQIAASGRRCAAAARRPRRAASRARLRGRRVARGCGRRRRVLTSGRPAAARRRERSGRGQERRRPSRRPRRSARAPRSFGSPTTASLGGEHGPLARRRPGRLA